MSDRLALSAAISAMMMAIYVLFGGDAAQLPVGQSGLTGSIELAIPDLSAPEQSDAPEPFVRFLKCFSRP